MKLKIRSGFLLASATALTWAFSIVTAKHLFNYGENPVNLAFWTTAFAAPVWLFHLFRHKKEFPKLKRKIVFTLFIIGFGNSIGIALVEVLAIRYTTAINFSFLIRSVVLFTIIFSAIIFKEKITFKKIVLACLIIFGSYLLILRGGGLVLQPGDVLTLIEAATIAFVNNILVKFTVSKIHPDLSAAVSYFVGLFFIIVVSLLSQSIKTPVNLLFILLIVVFDIILIQTRNRAYKVSTASFVTMIVSFTPVVVSLLSLSLLNEKMTMLQIIGGLMIVSTGLIAEYVKI
jgi:drug/metabolite transporter (DMT)-like permease